MGFACSFGVLPDAFYPSYSFRVSKVDTDFVDFDKWLEGTSEGVAHLGLGKNATIHASWNDICSKV